MPKCPSCESDQTMRARLVFERECRTGTISTSGGGFSTDGDVMLASMKAGTTSVSALGRRAAPPQEPAKPGLGTPAILLAGLGLVGGAFVLLLSQNPDFAHSWAKWFMLFVAMFAGGAALGVYSYRSSVEERRMMEPIYLDQIRRYERSWMCMQCGGRFEPVTP